MTRVATLLDSGRVLPSAVFVLEKKNFLFLFCQTKSRNFLESKIKDFQTLLKD